MRGTKTPDQQTVATPPRGPGRDLSAVPRHMRGTRTPDVQKIAFPKPAPAKKTDTSGLLGGTYLGNRYEGLAGADGAVADVLGIELETVRPVAVLFYQDTQLAVPPASSGTEEEQVLTYQYNQPDPSQPSDPDPPPGPFQPPNAGRLKLDVGTPATATEAYVSRVSVEGPTALATFLAGHSPLHAQLRWQNPGQTAFSNWVDMPIEIVDETPDYFTFSLATVGRTQNIVSQPAQPESILFLVRGPTPVTAAGNAAARARVTYSAHKSGDISFESDWAGGMVLFAKRIDIRRVNFAPDPDADYANMPIRIAVTAAVDGPRPESPAALTELPMAVAIGDTRLLRVPPFARRLRLLLKYGEGSGTSGDAPLGQIFVSFNDPYDNSVHWIDAMSARDALFGAGLPVPYGTSSLGLSNRSTDDTVRLGVQWVLGI